MAELPSKSPLQFEHVDGQVRLAGRPDVSLLAIPGPAVFPEWERTLGLPIYEEHWIEWARSQGWSGRHLSFVACDESPTKHVGNWRNQPKRIRVSNDMMAQQGGLLFTLGHTGYCIGLVSAVAVATQKSLTQRGLAVPEWLEGDCVIGEAVLCDSRLADAGWRGVQRGILDRVCAVVAMQPDEPPGTGTLVEIALVSEAEAACPGARVVQSWET